MITREWTRKEAVSLPLGHDSRGVGKKSGDIFPTRSAGTGLMKGVDTKKPDLFPTRSC